jgi:hypothetical protein
MPWVPHYVSTSMMRHVSFIAECEYACCMRHVFSHNIDSFPDQCELTTPCCAGPGRPCADDPGREAAGCNAARRLEEQAVSPQR